MTKKELVTAVAEAAEISKKDAEKAIKAFADIVSDELVNGGKIQLVRFGTFETMKREARDVRNPKTGVVTHAEAIMVPKFSASKALKQRVKEKV